MVLCKTFVQQNKRPLNIPDAIDRFQRRKTAGFCMHQTNEMKSNGQPQYKFDTLAQRLHDNRIIHVVGFINGEVSRNIIAQLLNINASPSPELITMVINSDGGEVDASLLIYDWMTHSTSIVQTVVSGNALRMASLLATAGARGHRYCTPNSKIMVNQPWGNFCGNLPQLENFGKRLTERGEKLKQLYQIHSGQQSNIVDQWFMQEKWFSPEEAIQFGLIDAKIPRFSCHVFTLQAE
jgi:ATP-dependent Clp protease protease subunit